MMLIASSMAPPHSLGQGNQIEMQDDIFAHVIPLAPPLHDANGIISGTIAFLRSR